MAQALTSSLALLLQYLACFLGYHILKGRKIPAWISLNTLFSHSMVTAGRASAEEWSRGEEIDQKEQINGMSGTQGGIRTGSLRVPAQLLSWEGGETRLSQAGVVSLVFLGL